MALRTILTVGDPLLRKKSRQVTDFDERLHTLLDDMWETLRQANGVGLAAVQVGALRRAIVIDASTEESEEGEVDAPAMGADHAAGRYELINPEILVTRGEKEEQEGCLSVPGYYGFVKRPAYVKLAAQDRNGNAFEVEAEGLLAKAIFHETDHLEGILYTDLAKDLEKVE